MRTNAQQNGQAATQDCAPSSVQYLRLNASEVLGALALSLGLGIMRYDLPTKFSGYLPSACALLESLRGEPLSHFERGRRHPIDIFSTAFRDALGNLDDLLDLVEVGQREQPYLPGNKPNDWEKKIIRQLDHAADSIVQYFDSCRAIILSCFEVSEKTQSTKAVRRFNTAAKAHTDRISSIVNLIKHNQRTLNLIYFHNLGVFIPGYYVEGVLEPEVVGPDPQIHPGSNTAISLFREIPAFVCAIYFVSSLMAHEVRSATHATPASDFKPIAELEKLALSVLKKTSLLPMQFFPDEIKMPVPLIRYIFKADATQPRVEIEMPSTRAKPRTPEHCQVATSFRVSSVSRTSKMPYMGKDHTAKNT